MGRRQNIEVVHHRVQPNAFPFHDVFELCEFGIVLFDVATHAIIECNPAATRILNISKEELIGCTPRDISPECQADGTLSEVKAAEYVLEIQKRGCFKFEWLLQSKNREPFPVEITVNVIQLPARAALLAHWQDLTEKKQMESSLKQINDELVRSNRELEQFAAFASHDLVAPLSNVAGFVELISRRMGSLADTRTSELLGFVKDAVVKMRRLVDDLLAYAKVQARELKKERVDLNELVKEIVGLLGMESAGAHVEIGVLPIVDGYPAYLRQLFLNLLQNAAKYRKPNEPPRIRIESSEVGNDIEIRVKDNGIGIDPKYFERIFQPFQRLHSQENYGGSGIGLAICKKVMELHGGQVWVESALGHGSTFFLHIPKRCCCSATEV